jgi:hypothetical protein
MTHQTQQHQLSAWNFHSLPSAIQLLCHHSCDHVVCQQRYTKSFGVGSIQVDGPKADDHRQKMGRTN